MASATSAQRARQAWAPLDNPDWQASADVLKGVVDYLMDNVKGKKPMEVQAGFFAGDDPEWYIASNGAGNYDGVKLGELASQESGTWKILFDNGLHAEQQILFQLAKRLANRNRKRPSWVTIIGTKRPCSVCRRVLLAFASAAAQAYGGPPLHFVDATGADTEVASVSFANLGGNDEDFQKFRLAYEYEYAQLQKRSLSGEDQKNNVRTQATTTVGQLI